MKIIDTTTFFEESMMMDIRFNILDPYIDKFIVCESRYTHSGKTKKINFNVDDYPKFKNKIIHLILEKEPDNLIKKQDLGAHEKRFNSIQRIKDQRNYIKRMLSEFSPEDYIIYSDNDEIPNLNSNQFNKSQKDIILFKQLFFYFKFNLLYDKMFWVGTKACKKKKLKSLSWLRNIKLKKYPFWRLDTLFSETKQVNLDIIEDGGWHFTNLKTAEEMYEKFMNFGHHDEFRLSGLTVKKIREKIKNKEMFYDHFADQSSTSKWRSDYKLKKYDLSLLPKHIVDNLSNYKEWIDN